MCVPLITQLLRLVGRLGSRVAVVTATKRHKSVRKRWVIEVFDGVFFCVDMLPLDFSVGIGAFVIGLSQISSILLLPNHIVNFPGLSVDVPRLLLYGINISLLVRFAKCWINVLAFHSKNLQITSKLLAQCDRYHTLQKIFGKFFRSYFKLLSKFGDISFEEYVSKGISQPVF